MSGPADRTTTGVVTWTDLGTTDLSDALAFYAELFGWSADPVAAPEAGGYTLLRRDGRLVAGAGHLTPGLQDQPWWDVHVAADVASTAARVAPAGGRLLAAPFDVLGHGTMAVAEDPAGAQVRLLQGLGAELTGASGSLARAELLGEEPAVDFYREVLGWDCEARPDVATGYSVLRLDGRPVAGVRRTASGWGCDGAEWLPYFAVPSVEDALRTATGLGAHLVDRPRGPRGTVTAVLRDRQGALFGLTDERP